MSRLNKTKLSIIAILLIIVGVTFFVAGSRNGNDIPNGDLRIGVVLPFSGDFSFIGNEIMRGMEIARSEAIDEGYNIQIFYEDDQSLAVTATVNAANKLVNIDNVDVGITALVEEAKPMGAIFNDNEVPLLVLWDSNKDLQEGGDYLFSTGFSTEKSGEKMANYAYNSLGLRKVAIVSHIDPFAEVISSSFSNEFESLGGEIAYKDVYFVSEEDYKSSLLKAKLNNVDGIYFPLLFPASVNFLKQSYEFGTDATLLSADSLIQDAIDESGVAAEGIYYTNLYTEPDKNLVLTQKYVGKYGEGPIDLTLVSFGYDGIKTVIEAYSYDSDDMREGMVKIIGESRMADKIEKIYVVADGRSIPLE